MSRSEVRHACVKGCAFRGRVCIATRNKHTCTLGCVIENSEGNYVCTLTGIVMCGSTRFAKVALAKKATVVKVPNHRVVGKRVSRWATEAARAFLVTSPVRRNLVSAALRRSAVKIRRDMGALPWGAKRLCAVAHSVMSRPPTMNALSPGLSDEGADPFIAWFVHSVVEYYDDVAHHVFKATRPGIGAFVAVMISCMGKGMSDANGIMIVEKNEYISCLAPSQVDYPRLGPGLVTCKAMSTGEFALNSFSMSNAGNARRSALFRPSQASKTLHDYVFDITNPLCLSSEF